MRQCSGSLVDLDAVQIVRQDQSRDVGRLIALLFVDRVQQIKRICQHVSAAAGRIADFDFFGAADPQEVGFRLLGLDVIIHLLDQPDSGWFNIHNRPSEFSTR